MMFNMRRGAVNEKQKADAEYLLRDMHLEELVAQRVFSQDFIPICKLIHKREAFKAV